MIQPTLPIAYQDSDFIGFVKPAGLPTTYGDQEDCFVARVKIEHPDLFSFAGFKEEEGGLLYRLDNETRGLVLFAKSRTAWERFTDDTELEKIYFAQVEDPESLPETGVIQAPLFHKSSKRMGVVQPGKKGPVKTFPAFTRYVKGGEAWIQVFIKKGARHQIRAHLAAIGHPVVGDSLYGKKETAGPLELICMGIESSWLKVFLDKKSALSVSNRPSASD